MAMATTKRGQSKEAIYPLSDIEEAILSILTKQNELYGLQISKTIELKSQGKLQISFGSLYPALKRLEARKLVKSHWGEEESEDRNGARRRYYKITDSGKKTLEEKILIRNSIIDWESCPA